MFIYIQFKPVAKTLMWLSVV